jgi:predicted Holliday junction resolvase-like endonuclease
MDSSLFSIAVVVVIILIIMVGIVYLAKRSKRGSGFQSSVLFGSTYEFYDKGKQAAIEVIVEEKAGKKMEEQKSGEPKDKGEEQSQETNK